MEKYVIYGVAILLAIFCLVGLAYNYHVEVNMLGNAAWTDGNIKMFLATLLFFGGFVLLRLVVVSDVSQMEEHSPINVVVLCELMDYLE